MSKSRFSACLASLSLAVVIQASDSVMYAQSTLADAPQGTTLPATPANKKTVAAKIAPMSEEAKELRAKAKLVTQQIGQLASTGELPSSQEAVQTLQDLVKELGKINERLEKMQEDIDGIHGWIEGQNETGPILQADVDQLKKGAWSNYVQVQFSDNQSNSSTLRPNDGFNLRRVRLGTTNRIDPRTSMKLSFDMAAGNRRLSAELKDAFLTYVVAPSESTVGTDLRAGQMSMPLGYELERSSSEREFPERAQYNQRMWAGERNRGLMMRHALNQNWTLHGGVWNALSVSDPQMAEQDVFRNVSGTRMAGHLGLKYETPNFEAGLSGFLGYRSDFSFTPTGGSAVSVPSGQRQFVYLDAAYIGALVPNLTLRGELMFGRDRVPQFSGSGASRSTSLNFDSVRGYHLQASYAFNYRNSLHARYEFFDPNVKANDNMSAFGLAYTYMINPGARLTLAHEWMKEEGLDVTNNITTLRLQYKL